MAQNGSTNQSDEILATSSGFVPTALNGAQPDDRGQASDDGNGGNEVVRGPERNGEPDRNGEPVDWQTAMKLAIRDTAQLRRLLRLPPQSLGDQRSGDPDGEPATKTPLAATGSSAPRSSTSRSSTSRSSVPAWGVSPEESFATFVPLEFLRRIKPGDPNDPLLRQVLAVPEENISSPRETSDPVGDLVAKAAPGLIHKYEGRALMVVTGACGVHCRYCFRREFPYQLDSGSMDHWDQAIDYLQDHPEIDEVLLSGGDPLTRTDENLDRLLQRLESVKHLRRLRIHSRMPIVIPQRVTSELVKRLVRSRLSVWFVVHANHPRELDDDVLTALARMIDRGIPVLNQAVLLQGVNDDAETLIELCRRLVDHRVQPYYLHQLDRVHGTSHFEVSVQRGKQLIEELRAALPGYAVPKYVVEEAGRRSKTPV